MAKLCPLLQKECIQHQCEFYIHMIGMDPQTGQPKDEWGCTFRWLPILLTENANQIRQAAASSDKVANEVAKHHGTFLAALPPEVKDQVIRANPRLVPKTENPQIGPGQLPIYRRRKKA